jgi:hypothetical protein
MKIKQNKSWVILEVENIKGEDKYTVLAGTEDIKAINTALAAIKDFKDRCIKDGKLDLTEIRTSVVDDLSPVNQILNQDDEEVVDRLLSMVGSGHE